MPDALYVRGWDDCLEAIVKILTEAEDLKEMKDKVERLRKLIKEDKFEKIRYELGAFNLF